MKQAKHLAFFVTLLLCGYPLEAAASDSLRTWTDVQGRTLSARLLQVLPGKSAIEIERADGSRFTLPVARLSYADQQFVQQLDTQPTENAAMTELSAANWEWLTHAGTVTARQYVHFPADSLVAMLNARLTAAQSESVKQALKGVRIDADADLKEINAKIEHTVNLATFLKAIAEQNDLQLRVDGNGLVVFQRTPKDQASEKNSFLGL
jgi:hypothetical protein